MCTSDRKQEWLWSKEFNKSILPMYRLCFTWWHIFAILFQAEQVAYVVIIQFSSLDLLFLYPPQAIKFVYSLV